jgi:3-(3-hydroxy-phenyl)propionate hydroxylase
MNQSPNRVLIVGAGPVGLCLALKLAKHDVASTVIEQLADENFLDQVPRAGTNHPVTLEMYDDIGLYAKLEPRGIIAPLFHYWDREKAERIAEFDHIHLRNDTPFPFALQCERIKIVEEALAMAKANPLIEIRMATTFTGFTQDGDGVTAFVDNEAGEQESLRGRYIVSAEGARSIVRKESGIEFEGFTYPDRTLNIEVA